MGNRGARIEKLKECRVNMACHNINGIRGNKVKLKAIAEWACENEIDLLGLVETNSSEKELRFSLDEVNMKGFWSQYEVTKRKGSGVGLLVGPRWEKHLGQVCRFEEYMIEARFYFKQSVVVVIVVYLPPSDKTLINRVQQKVITSFMQRTSNMQFVVMGDFNHVVDRELDKRSNGLGMVSKVLPLHKWFKNQGFIDTFRIVNPDLMKYSWSGQGVETRIDQIWVSEDLKYGVLAADIVEADIITASDHAIVTANITMKHVVQVRSAAAERKKEISRNIYLYDEATKEDWKQYQEDLLKLTVNNRALTRCWTLTTSDKLNLIWDIIASAIRRAADKNIPKKKVSSSSNNRTRKCKSSKLHKSTVKLGKIIQMVKRAATYEDWSIDIEMLSKEIEQINNMHQADIPKLSCGTYEKETLYKWVYSAKVC